MSLLSWAIGFLSFGGFLFFRTLMLDWVAALLVGGILLVVAIFAGQRVVVKQ